MKTIAVAKGYLFKEALAVLEKAGIFFDIKKEDSRLLSFVDREKQWKLYAVRPWDVPVYVSRGAADFGIVGYDVLAEQREKVAVLKDLHFGQCSLILAAKKEAVPLNPWHNIRVATKYPYCTEQWFCHQGIKIRLIKLYGAIELAPHTGLADIVCDLTATGTTLKENGLEIIDTLFSSTAQLIANPGSLSFYYREVKHLLKSIS